MYLGKLSDSLHVIDKFGVPILFHLFFFPSEMAGPMVWAMPCGITCSAQLVAPWLLRAWIPWNPMVEPFHQDTTTFQMVHVGITMSWTTHFPGNGVPPLKMVMTEGWFLIVIHTLNGDVSWWENQAFVNDGSIENGDFQQLCKITKKTCQTIFFSMTTVISLIRRVDHGTSLLVGCNGSHFEVDPLSFS